MGEPSHGVMGVSTSGWSYCGICHTNYTGNSHACPPLALKASPHVMGRVADALERIADALEAPVPRESKG